MYFGLKPKLRSKNADFKTKFQSKFKLLVKKTKFGWKVKFVFKKFGTKVVFSIISKYEQLIRIKIINMSHSLCGNECNWGGLARIIANRDKEKTNKQNIIILYFAIILYPDLRGDRLDLWLRVCSWDNIFEWNVSEMEAEARWAV